MPRHPSKGAGKGVGWGGAVKGAGKPPGNLEAGRPTAEDAAEIAARREARAEALLDHIDKLATGAERQETQLTAAIAYIDRVKGKPTQRQEITMRDVPVEQMTDNELAAIAGRGR